MSNKIILNTLLMMGLVFGVGVTSTNSSSTASNNSSKSVAVLKKEANDTSSFQGATEVNSNDLIVSFTRSTTTPSCQSYQVTFSSKISAMTDRNKNVYIVIDDPSYTGQETSPENPDDMPVFNGIAFRVQNELTSGIDAVIPRRMKRGSTYYIQPTVIASDFIDTTNNGPVNSLLIPENITTIYEDSFTFADSSIVFNIMSEKEDVSFDETYFPEGATINWGYVPTADEEKKLEVSVYGSAVDFGTGKDFILGYMGYEDGHPEIPLNLPLSVQYDIYDETTGEFIETRSQQLPIVSTSGNYYDSVGSNISSTSFKIAIDIDLAPNEMVDDENVVFYNIYYAIRGVDNIYRPDVATGMFYAVAQCSYAFKDSIDNYIIYNFESLYTFQGYTSVVLNVDIVDGIYQRLNQSSYESNLNSINNGSIVLRYRFTSLTSAYYHIVYNYGGVDVETDIKISTPVNYTNLAGKDNNKVNFMLKNSNVGDGFSASKIKEFSIVGLYITLDLYIPKTNSIVTKSAVSSRFGTIEVLDSATEVKSSLVDFNIVLIWLMVIYTIIFVIVTLAYFFYVKRAYRNDEFRRVKPKQFFKQAAIAYLCIGLIILAITFIYMRFWPLNNSVVVYNPSDIYVIFFSIAAVIAIGYYIRYFAIMIRTNIERKKAAKLKLDEDVADDGTH